MSMVFDHLLIDGERFSVDDEDNLTEINKDTGRSNNRKQPRQIRDSIRECHVVGTNYGLTPHMYLHKGAVDVSGDANSGARVSPTVHRGAHELPRIVSCTNNASGSLAQCRGNAGRNNMPVQRLKWISNVTMQLFQHSFGFVLMNQGVGGLNSLYVLFVKE